MRVSHRTCVKKCEIQDLNSSGLFRAFIEMKACKAAFKLMDGAPAQLCAGDHAQCSETPHVTQGDAD